MLVDRSTIVDHLACHAWKAYRGQDRVWPADLTIGPNSIDVTLGSTLLYPTCAHLLDPTVEDSGLTWEERKPHDEWGFVLYPGDFCLGYVQERFNVDAGVHVEHQTTETEPHGHTILTHHSVAPMIEGRSTLARLGIAVHITAGFGDVGFKGNFTLEIKNQGPLGIRLKPGMRIAQVYFQTTTPGLQDHHKYAGAYNDDHIGRPVPPKLGPGRF